MKSAEFACKWSEVGFSLQKLYQVILRTSGTKVSFFGNKGAYTLGSTGGATGGEGGSTGGATGGAAACASSYGDGGAAG